MRDKNYKIVDCFLFNDELEMLKMRLDYYGDCVDYFVISESTTTLTGIPKELVYPTISHLFEEYSDRIHYIVYAFL